MKKSFEKKNNKNKKKPLYIDVLYLSDINGYEIIITTKNKMNKIILKSTNRYNKQKKTHTKRKCI